MDAFDSDVLIYAAIPEHSLGSRVAGLIPEPPVEQPAAAVGSVLLLPEVLTKPLRRGDTADIARLSGLLARLDLRPVDQSTAQLAVALATRYGLRSVDAIHLATAVAAGADRFITNNRRDYRADLISEVAVTYPDDL